MGVKRYWKYQNAETVWKKWVETYGTKARDKSFTAYVTDLIILARFLMPQK